MSAYGSKCTIEPFAQGIEEPRPRRTDHVPISNLSPA